MDWPKGSRIDDFGGLFEQQIPGIPRSCTRPWDSQLGGNVYRTLLRSSPPDSFVRRMKRIKSPQHRVEFPPAGFALRRMAETIGRSVGQIDVIRGVFVMSCHE